MRNKWFSALRASTPRDSKRLSKTSRGRQYKRRLAWLERLEARRLLASDLIVDAPNRDVELQMVGDLLQILDRADDSVLAESSVAEIEDLVQIRSRSFLADSNIALDGNALLVYAKQSIAITQAEITTTDLEDTEDAGRMHFESPSIHISAGSTLGSSVTDGSTRKAGRITLKAVDGISPLNRSFQETSLPIVGDARTARIDIENSLLVGADIVLESLGDTTSRWDSVAAYQDSIASEVIEVLQQAPQIAMSAVSPLSGQVKVHQSSSSIRLNNASITSSGSVAIDANSTADASVNALAINGTNRRFMGSVGFSSSKSSATINLLGTTTIDAASFVDLQTHASSTAQATTRSEGGSQFSAGDVDYAFNLALALTHEVSVIDVGQFVEIAADGRVTVNADGAVINKAKADTALFQDGEAALSFAVGVDNAEVRAKVSGVITSRDVSNVRDVSFTPNDINAADDQIRLTVPATAPLSVGEHVRFQQRSSADVGLVDQAEYLISEVWEPVSVSEGQVSQLVRLTRAPSLPLDARQVPEDSLHSFSKVAVVEFPISAVRTESTSGDGRIQLTLPAGVNRVTYLGPDSTEDSEDETRYESIPGLIQNRTYEVVRVGAEIKLRDLDSREFVDFAEPEAGPNHGLEYYETVVHFGPRNAVEYATSRVTLPSGHGLQTGDLIVYGVDPSRSISREVGAFDAAGIFVGKLGDVQLPDAPIGGLQNNIAYRVIVDPHRPNEVRLASSLIHAELAKTVNLQAASSGEFVLERFEFQEGIRVDAHLHATNFAQAGVNLTGGQQPWPALIQNATHGQIDDIAQLGFEFFNSARQAVEGNTKQIAEGGTGTQSSSKLDAAGSLAIAHFIHVVQAEIAPAARLLSYSKIDVDAATQQAVKLGVTAESTRNALNEGGQGTQDGQGNRELALGVGVGVYRNQVHAIVDDHATLDAIGDTSVRADVFYPLLTEAEGNQQTVGMGLAAFNAWLDGRLDFSNLTNVYSRSIATADSDDDEKVLAFGGGIALTFSENDVVAQIGSGAQLNQDANFQGSGRAVRVEAELEATFIEVGQMMSVNLSAPGIVEAIIKGTERNAPDIASFLKDLVNPFGVSGNKAFGGTLILNTTDNRVVAEIESEAVVSATNLDVIASSEFYNFAGVQTGTGSTELGFSAAIAASNLASTTTAAVHEDARITTGVLEVSALDALDRITYAGAVLKGKQAGIGTSIGVNVVAQNVAAFIGREDRELDGDPANAVPLYATNSARIVAEATGAVHTVTISGALQGLGASSAGADSKQSGPIAITAPVAFNSLTTKVDAYLDNQHADEVGSLELNAHAATSTKALVIGGSFAVQTGAGANSGKLNLAGAGAVGVNRVHQTVDASVHDSLVTAAEGVTISATDASDVEADAGGLALAFGAGPNRGTALSFGASVAINDVSGHTRAIVDHSELEIDGGDLVLSAAALADETGEGIGSRVRGLAVGGAASLATAPSSASFGALGAAVQNWVNRSVSAEIINGSNLILSTGDVSVLGRDESQIIADVGGLSFSGGVATKVNAALGIGLAFNDVENSTIARIGDSKIYSYGSILVRANVPSAGAAARHATIDALSVAGSLGLAGSHGLSATLAGAGSGSNNQVHNTITAEVVNSDVQSVVGGIDVAAHDATSMVATTVGAAIDAGFASGLSGAVAVGLSIARNTIENTTTAKIVGGTTSTSEGDLAFLQVGASDASRIDAVAVAASLAISGASAPAFAMSGGGAEASNVILSDVDALVQAANIEAFTLTVSADSTGTIQSGVYGVTSSVAGSGAAGGSATIGASVANNFVGYKFDGSKQDARVHAEITGSTIDLSHLKVKSNSKQDIDAESFVGGFVVAGASGAGGAAAGSGTKTANRIGSSVLALIDGNSAPDLDVAQSIELAATDESTIHANTTAVTVAGFVGGAGGGAVQVGISLAENVVDNRIEALMDSVTLVDAHTPTVRVTATQSEHSVMDSKSVATSVSGSAAGGATVAISGAGAASVNTVANKTYATIRASELHASTIDVMAESQAKVTSEILTASVAAGFSAGTAGGVGVGINDAHNVIGDTTSDRSQPERANLVIASIVGRSSINSTGSVSVLATNKDSITAAMNADVIAAAGSPGLAATVAGGGTSAANTVASEVAARVAGASDRRLEIDSGDSVRLIATDASDVTTTVGGVSVGAVIGVYGGGVSIAVSKAESEVRNLVEASIEYGNIAAENSIEARTTERADLETYSYTTSVGATVALGGNITGGGAVAYGRMASQVRSRAANSNLHSGSSVQVQSTASSHVDSATKPLGVSLLGLAANGSVPTAIIEPTVESLVLFADVATNDFRVETDFNPLATADATGFQVAVGATVGASDATVDVGGRVTSAIYTGDHLVNVDRLTIHSQASPLEVGFNPVASYATANASSGGLLLGTNSAYSESLDRSRVIARIGDGSSNIWVGTATTVRADTANLQRAKADAYSGGVIGVGVPTAIIENDLTTQATLGTGVNIDGGSLEVVARGRSNALSEANAGTGGVVAGSVTQSKVDNHSATEAGIGVAAGNPPSAGVLNLESLKVEADFTTQTNAVLGAVAGGVLSGQGGFVYNDVNSIVTSIVGDQTAVTASSMEIEATQHVAKPDLGRAGNVDATTGGLITGGGVGSHANFVLNTSVDIGADAVLRTMDDETATLALAAANSIDATDRMTARAGGVGAQAHVDSTITANTMRATIDIADNATLTSTGSIDIAATGTADAQIQANSTAGGVVTIGSGIAEITLLPRNEIKIGGNARLSAIRDLNLRAGIGTYDAANYQLEARMDTFGGSLIPIESIDGRVTLLEKNEINVTSGAVVESGGNIGMHAERHGFNQVDGVAKAVNWVSGVGSVISSLDAEGGVEQSTGFAISKAFGAITVDGSVRTGLGRHQEVRIDTFAYAGSGDSDAAENYLVQSEGNITFTKHVEPVISSLHQDLIHAKEQLSEYTSNVSLRQFYEAEVERLEDELRAQGLLVLEQPQPGSNASPREVAAERKTLVLAFYDLYAEAGEIRVSGDRLVGSGVLDAPGDASISITNNSLATIQLGGIEIADSTGGVLFNAAPVSEAGHGDLESIRDAISTENLSNLDIEFFFEPEYSASAAFTKVVGGAAAPPPTISVRNTATTTTFEGTVYPWPNIRVEDVPLRNISGSVKLINHASGAGSIIITAQIVAAELTMQAGNQGTTSISLPGASSIYEVGGTEYASIHDQLYDTHSKKGIVPLDASPNSNPRFTEYLATEPTSPSLSAGRIFIEARYIIVNGLIESGQSHYELTIGEQVADEIAQSVADGKTGIHVLESNTSDDFSLRYDYDRQRIIVSELAVSGGYVELSGIVTNTRQGEIRVFGGYANINIDNQTEYDIELQRIDAGRRGEGTVIINDLARGDGTTAESYHYVRKGDVIEQSRFLLSGQTHYEVFALDDSIIYLPNPGLRYGWSVVEDRSTEFRRTYRSSSWLGAIDELSPDSEIITQSGPTTFSAEVHGSGAYFYQASATNRPRYTYGTQTLSGVSYPPRPFFDTPPPWRLIHEWTEWTGAFLWAEEHHYSKWVQTYRDQLMHEHTIRADRPIDIEFFGEAEGKLNIQSSGDIYIAGVLDNSSGTTRIAANHFSSVHQVGDQGLVRARNLHFYPSFEETGSVGSQSLGSEVHPLNTDLQGLSHEFSTADAPATILEGQRVRVELGHESDVNLTLVYRFLGLREEVNFATEDYGDASRWQPVEDFGEIRANLGFGNQEIHLNELYGDIRLGFVNVGLLNVSAQRNITSTTSDIFSFADRYALTARTGSIGSLEHPLHLSGNTFSPIITAQAAHDVYLFTNSSNFGIESIVAGGHVQIDATESARVEDANFEAVEDTRAIEAITQEVWIDLQLTEEFGASAKRQERIKALEATRTRDYHRYWLFRNTQEDSSEYDPAHRIQLTQAERDFYLDAGQIATLENSRTEQYHGLQASIGSLTSTYDADYEYQATDAELLRFDAEKVWTVEELTNLSQPYGVLGVSDTEFVVEEPNIVAASVTLNAAKGVGSFRNGAVVELNRSGGNATISLRDSALMAAAEPGDFVYLSKAPVFVPDFLFNPEGLQLPGGIKWSDYGFEIGQTIMIQSDNWAVEERLFEIVQLEDSWMGVDADDIFPGKYQETSATIGTVITDPDARDQATHLLVLRREDVDIDSPGPIIATSEHNVFLGSEGDLHLERIHAGTQHYDARVEVRATGSLVDASRNPDQPTIIGGRVLLESARESIGSPEAPIRLGLIENHSLIARADDRLAIVQLGDVGNADLRVNELFSRNEPIVLNLTGSLLDAFDSEATNIQAPGLVLRTGGSIGSAGNPLEINLTGTGTLTAIAGRDVVVTETVGDLNLRQVFSQTGDVLLVADISILDAVDVEDATNPQSIDSESIEGLPRTDIVGNHISLTAKLGSIGAAANEVDVDSRYGGTSGSVTSSSGANTYLLETTGDLYLGRIEADDATAFIAAPGGSIYSALGLGQANVLGGKLWLFCLNDIGTQDLPLESYATAIEAVATTGSMYLQQNVPLEVGGVIGGASEGENGKFKDGIATGQHLTIRGKQLRLSERLDADGDVLLVMTEAFTMPAGTIIAGGGGNVEISTPNIAIDRGAVVASTSRIALSSPGQIGAAIIIDGALLAQSIVSVVGSQRDDVIRTDLEDFSGTQFIVSGGAGDDVIVGSRFNDTIYGDTGEDSIEGGLGCDVLRGGEGFDTYLKIEACDDIGTLTATVDTISENVARNTVVAVIGFEDLDPDDSVTYRVVDSDSPFGVRGSELVVLAPNLLNRRTSTQFPVTIAADHAQGGTTFQTFKVTVNADNDAPVHMRLDSKGLPENTVSFVVGDLSVWDPDLDDMHSFTVADPRFEIVNGNTLKLRDDAAVNFEQTPQILLDITATDLSGLSIKRSVTVSVLDLDDPPSAVELVGALLLENLEGMTLGELQISDEDTSYRFSIDDSRFELVGNELRLKSNYHLNRSEDPKLTFEVTITDVLDATNSFSQSFEFDVTPNPFPWQNLELPEDVNRDGFISPIDALLIINALNSGAPNRFPATRAYDSLDPFSDTNGDGFLSPIDALIVINYLNRASPAAEGEGRAMVAHDFYFAESAIAFDHEQFRRDCWPLACDTENQETDFDWWSAS